jgi:hypothetical protein
MPAIEVANVKGDVVGGGGTNVKGAESEKEEEKVEDGITEAFNRE